MKENMNIKSFLLKTLLLAGITFSINAVPAAAQQLPQLEWVGKMEEITTEVKSTINSSGDIFTTGGFNPNPDFDLGTGPADTFTLRGQAGGFGTFICKTFANGDFAWVRGFGVAQQDSSGFAEIAPPVTDKFGNLYMFFNGYTYNSSSSVALCLDYGTGVLDTFSFPASALGNSSSNDYILKFNDQGQLVWMKEVCSGAMGINVLYKSAAVTDDYGNIYITQAFSDTLIFNPGGVANTLVLPTGQSGVFLCKLDSAGNVLWNRSILTSENPFWGDLKMATDGKNALFISGSLREVIDFDPGPGTALLNPDSVGTIFVDKLDLEGNFLKAFGTGRQADGIGGAMFQAMAVDASGNSYLTGTFGGLMDFDPSPDSFMLNAALSSIFVTKFSPEGGLLWAKPLYNVPESSPYLKTVASNDIAVDGKGNVFLTGGFSNSILDFDPGTDSFNLTGGGGTTIFVCKLAKDGNFGWAFVMSGRTDYGGFGTSINVTDSGDIYTTGYFSMDTIDFDPGPGTLYLSPNLWSAAFIQKLKDNTSTGIVSTKMGNESIRLYPNPAGNELWLKSSGKVQMKTVAVYNMLGQVMLQEKVSSGSFYRLDVRSLSPGLYVLKALLSNGHVALGKFEKR